MVTAKTKTAEQRIIGHEHVSEESLGWSKAADSVTAFTYESGFLQACGEYGATPEDTTSYGYAMVLDSYVTDFVDIHLQDGTLSKDEAARLRITGGFPAWAYRSKLINDWRGTTLGKEDLEIFRDCKKRAVNYIQTMTNYMYEHSDTMKMSDVGGAIFTATANMAPEPEGIQGLRQQMAQMLRGARTEAVNHSLVDRLEVMTGGHIRGEQASEAEDNAGVDFKVLLGEQELLLDFKSSITSLLKGEAPTRDDLANGYKITPKRVNGIPRPVAVIMPTFNEENLGDSCALDDMAAGQAALALANNLGKISKQVA